jgi:aryl-alcohol dehydrogenase-like predicted oxidoreductase
MPLSNCNKSEWGNAQQDPIRLVHAAIDPGINFFDSALNYGQGVSMENLGKALINKRADVVLNNN